MSNKLDDIIKDKLSQKTVGDQPADWDVFSQLLKKAEGFESINTDSIIEEKVGRHTALYNENHWQLLKERLVKEEILRKKIFTSKAIESILLLLLLLAFQNYDGYIFQQSLTFNSNEAVVSNSKKISYNTDFETTNSLPQKSSSQETLSIPSEDLLSFAQSVEAYTLDNFSAVIVHNNDDFQKNGLVYQDLEASQLTQRPDQSYKTDILFIESIKPKFLENLTPSIDDKLGINVLENSNSKLSYSSNLPSSILPIIKPQKFLTASLSYGLGIAKSDYDAIYNIKGYNTYSSQYGLGFLYSIKNNKIEVQSGLRYSKKNYEPSKLTETYGNLYKGYREISLDKISYDIVDVPLSIKYFFNEGIKNSFFIKAGVNANFSVANKYLVESSYTTLSNNTYAAKLEISDSKELDQTTKLSQKDFSPGLLQKTESHSFLSKIAENTFFTVSAEIGVERKLSKDNALVFGVEYNKYYKIDGIGPNKDKLSALTLNFGLKHSIN